MAVAVAGGNGKPSVEEFAQWVDNELAQDRTQATSDYVIAHARDYMETDPEAYGRLLAPVFDRHEVRKAVEARIGRGRSTSSKPPEPDPPPTDKDHARHDPRAKGGPQDPEEELTFRVSKIRKIDTRPPTWCVEIDGSVELELSSKEFKSPSEFETVYMENLNRMPIGMPGSKVWKELIARWLADPNILVIEEVGDERSDADAVRITTAEVLEDIAIGEDPNDLWRTHCLAVDGGFIVRQATLRTLVEERAKIGGITHKQMAGVMRALGAQPTKKKVPGKGSVAVWKFKRTLRPEDRTDLFDGA